MILRYPFSPFLILKWLFSPSAVVVLSLVYTEMPLFADILSHHVSLPLVESLALSLVSVLLLRDDVLFSVETGIHSLLLVLPLVAGVLPFVALSLLHLKSTWKFGSNRYTKRLGWLKYKKLFELSKTNKYHIRN